MTKHVRWKQVAIAALGLTAIAYGLLALGAFGWHRYRLWQSDGEWCIQFAPDGTQQTRYGEDCGF